MLRTELERKTEELKCNHGIYVDVSKKVNKVQLNIKNKSFTGTVDECYSFLLGFMAALENDKTRRLNYASE